MTDFNLKVTGYVATVAGGLLPLQDRVGFLGTADKRFGDAWIGKLKLSTDDYKDNGITTTEGDLYLNSSDGNVQIEDNLIVTETLTVNETSEFKKAITIDDNISPNTFKGARIGTESFPFSDAHVGNIQIAYGLNGIASDDDNLISTSSGDLKLNSASQKVLIVNDLEVSRNLRVVGFSTFVNPVSFQNSISPASNEGSSLGTSEKGWSEAYIDEIYINNNTITTTVTGTGDGQDLELSSSSGLVDVEFDINVGRYFNSVGLSTFNDKLHVGNNIHPLVTKGSSLGESNKVFSAAYIDDLIFDGNTITTVSGKNLIISPNGGILDIQVPMQLGITTFTDNVTLKGLDKTFIVRNNTGVEKFKIESNEGNTVTQGTLECKTITTTRNLTVSGQNSSTTHAQIGSASVKTQSTSTTSGSLVVYGGIGVESGNVNVSGYVSVGSSFGVTGTSQFTGAATFSGLINANGGVKGTCSLATKATNVVGSTNCIPFNTGTDITTTSSNLTFINGVNPELRVAGDIVAFYGSSSDDTLKENKTKLDNALDKVLLLSGFTYTWNEKAVSLGFDSSQTCVGVSAQEVQKVLPEAVIERELNGENILLVKYEKIVPLLIEAIKELNDKVDRLQSLLDK